MQRSTLVLAPALVLAMAAPALASDVGPLVQVSEASPFGDLSNCGSFPGVILGSGVNFVDSEVEPFIDVNPLNNRNLFAFWQQDRWSNGGARSNVGAVSYDGGESFRIITVPGLTECSGGPFERASDPWVSFGPTGILYQISLVFNTDPPTPDPLALGGRNGLAVSRSTDGGRTFSDPILIIDSGPLQFNDKQTLTADPTDADLVYAVWDRLELVNEGIDFRGPGLFARSTDRGLTFEPAREIFDPGVNNQIIGAQIVVLPDGTVLNFFNQIINFLDDGSFNPVPFTLVFQRSDDQGVTFTPDVRGFPVDDIQALGVVTPDVQAAVRDASILFDVAVDPVSGAIYAVFQDARFSGFDEVAFTMSSDGGLSWSETIRINETPFDPANPLRAQAFIPSVAVAGDGTVGVSYYDFRNDVSGAPELADHFLIRCASDCADPSSWGEEIRLSDESFDYLQAPTANGLFLGDYVGLAGGEGALFSYFQKTSDTDRGNGFFRSVSTR